MRAKRPAAKKGREPRADAQEILRGRIMGAAFRLLSERGYAGTNTLEIARRAKVSKRELYALFGSKHGIVLQMVAMGASRMQLPLRLPEWHGRREFAALLVRFGATSLREITSPMVTAFYRLAITEAERSTEIAQALDTAGRQSTRELLVELMQRAQTEGHIGHGDPAILAGDYAALLWRDLLVRVLLRVVKPPTEAEAEVRARAATDAFLALHPPGAGTAD
jgi:AcrR family transcriptional regulator